MFAFGESVEKERKLKLAILDESPTSFYDPRKRGTQVEWTEFYCMGSLDTHIDSEFYFILIILNLKS